MKRDDVHDVPKPPEWICVNPDCTTCGGDENPHAGIVLQGRTWIPCPECVEYSERGKKEDEGGSDE